MRYRRDLHFSVHHPGGIYNLVCNFPPGGLHFYLMVFFVATSTVSARMSTVIVNDRYKQKKNSTMNKADNESHLHHRIIQSGQLYIMWPSPSISHIIIS